MSENIQHTPQGLHCKVTSCCLLKGHFFCCKGTSNLIWECMRFGFDGIVGAVHRTFVFFFFLSMQVFCLSHNERNSQGSTLLQLQGLTNLFGLLPLIRVFAVFLFGFDFCSWRVSTAFQVKYEILMWQNKLWHFINCNNDASNKYWMDYLCEESEWGWGQLCLLLCSKHLNKKREEHNEAEYGRGVILHLIKTMIQMKKGAILQV